MHKIALGFLIMATPVSAAQAQNMPLPQFLTKATALEKRGPFALLSSDMSLLKKEIRGSALFLRRERLAAEKAGRKGAFCPPANSAQIGAQEILAHFRAIPAAQRGNMQVKDAMRSFMARKYPCKA